MSKKKKTQFLNLSDPITIVRESLDKVLRCLEALRQSGKGKMGGKEREAYALGALSLANSILHSYGLTIDILNLDGSVKNDIVRVDVETGRVCTQDEKMEIDPGWIGG